MKLTSFVKSEAQYLRGLFSSKSVGEFFDKVTWGFIGRMAFFTVLAIIVSPLVQFLESAVSFALYGVENNYFLEVVHPANIKGTIVGIITIMLTVGKNRRCGYGVKQFLRDHAPMRFFIPFIGLVLVSTCVNGFTYYAVHGFEDIYVSVSSYILFFLIYFFCASLIDSGKVKAVIEYIVVFVGFVIGVAALYHQYVEHIEQFFAVPHENNNFLAEGVYALTAVFYNANHYGYFLVLVTVLSGCLFALEKNTVLKSFCFVTFIINAHLTIVCDMFSAFLAVLFALIFLVIVVFLCRKKICVPGILLLVLFLGITVLTNALTAEVSNSNTYADVTTFVEDIGSVISNPQESSNAGNGRWEIWTTFAKRIAEKPLLGHGNEGTSDEIFPMFLTAKAHNNFLHYATFFGIPAAFLYFCGVMSVFFKGLKNRFELDTYTIVAIVGSFGYLVTAFFGVTTFYVTPIFFVIFGLAASGKRHG